MHMLKQQLFLIFYLFVLFVIDCYFSIYVAPLIMKRKAVCSSLLKLTSPFQTQITKKKKSKRIHTCC